ncbi:hypothetical protein MGN70_013651 [Eutypa lata]|nr:hypothetical protein MGN70_013651 [Eutypa lata]
MFARVAFRRKLRSLSAIRSLSRSSSSSSLDTTHVVIGGGVIGLAIARRLAATANPTVLIERHRQVGTETSSRNSEVIHAGLYYGRGTLKTRLCIRGRDALYAFCAERGVAHRRTGKWIVAQDSAELEALERIAEHCASMDRDADGEEGALRAPVRFLGKEEARRREPDVRAEAGVLESPETGIIDSHGLMLALQGLFEDAGGMTVLGSEVVGIEPLASSSNNNNSSTSVPGSSGWRLTVRDTTPDADGNRAESTIATSTIINSAGLGAAALHNHILRHHGQPERQVKSYYAKGNYFSYGASRPHPSRLIYPAPTPGHAGLGTHLTLDLAGRVRFGPDAEWVDAPDDLAVSAERLPRALAEIRKYLPAVDAAALAPDYAGIRPKLGRLGGTNTNNSTDGKGGGGGFQDFYIRKEEGFEGWVNLLGMESPGLTSCLAIADYVKDLLYASQSPKP